MPIIDLGATVASENEILILAEEIKDRAERGLTPGNMEELSRIAARVARQAAKLATLS